jgi:hypothetical protein
VRTVGGRVGQVGVAGGGRAVHLRASILLSAYTVNPRGGRTIAERRGSTSTCPWVLVDHVVERGRVSDARVRRRAGRACGRSGEHQYVRPDGSGPRRCRPILPAVPGPVRIPGVELGSDASGLADAGAGVHAVIVEAADLLDGVNRELTQQADAAVGPPSPGLESAQDQTFRAAAVLGAVLLLERAAAAGGPTEPAAGFDVDGPWILTSDSRRLLYASPAACALLERTRSDLDALVGLGYVLRGEPAAEAPVPAGPMEMGFAIEMPDGHAREVRAITYALPDDAAGDRCYVTLLRAAAG